MGDRVLPFDDATEVRAALVELDGAAGMTEELWRAAEIAAATGGEARGDWAVAGVSIDSRTVRRGELFIALLGPNHDGHAFVKDALARGAAAPWSIVCRPG